MTFHKHQTHHADLRAGERKDVEPGLDLGRLRAP